MLVGALAYTLGAVLEFQRWPVVIPGVVRAHELFHLAVLIGLFCHWRFVMQFASGYVPQPLKAAGKRPVPSANGRAPNWCPRDRWRQTVVMVLETRFGALPDELAAGLETIETLAGLDGLPRTAATCASYQEFRASLGC